MKRRFFLFLILVLTLGGCSLFEEEVIDKQEEIPKSYTLAIGYANDVKWERAMEQLLKTLDDPDANETYRQAALLLAAHITNGELTAQQETGANENYNNLLQDRYHLYERLLEQPEAVSNDPFLGLNFNVQPMPLNNVNKQEQSLFEKTNNFILTHWSVIFNGSTVDVKMLLEQSGDAVNEGDEQLAMQLIEHASSFE